MLRRSSNLPSTWRGEREDVSLHYFKNRDTLIMNHFGNHAVEDELKHSPNTVILRLAALRFFYFTY